jgi:DNA-binding NarL/FixJ family response regulator
MSNGILIADDSASARRAIRAYLRQRDLEVCGEAIDGVDALEKATELEPALILLDLRMPRMNGVEAAAVLRGRRPNLRIVLLTLYDEVLSCKPMLSAIGFDAIISKPDGFSSLGECVRGLLGSAPVPPEDKP